jgi:hypothetical protein
MVGLPALVGDFLYRFGPVLRRFKDMLDGTHAEVVAVGDVESVVQVTQGPVQPVAQVLVLTADDTEYSVELNANYGFEFKARPAVDVRFAFETGVVATPTEPYLTLPGGWMHYQEGQFDEVTVYFAHSIGAPVTMEIITLEPVV